MSKRRKADMASKKIAKQMVSSPRKRGSTAQLGKDLSPGALRAPASPIAGRKKPARASKETSREAAFTPYIQPTRWPRDISLDKVVKRKDMGDLAALAKSIDTRGGLLQPIVIIAQDGTDYLIAGQRRLAAWALSRFRKDAIPVHVMPAIDSILAGEWDENAQRKDFSPSEQVELVDALLPEMRAQAQQRQRSGKKAEQGEAGEAMAHLARYLGASRPTLEKAKAVVEAARAEPDKFSDLVAAMDKSGKVNGAFKRLATRRQVAEIADKKKSGRLDLPKGTYDRVVVDYAWPHEPGNEKPDRATRPYATMPISEGMTLMRDLRKRLAKDCSVWFWTTGFHMQYAYTLLRAAGLTMPGDARKDDADATKGAVSAPVILVWAKDTIGQGQRLREQAEFCIVAIKGNPTWNDEDLPSTLLHGSADEHSQKPATFYQLLDQVAPAQRSLELFARRTLPEGWDGWGDQVGKFKEEIVKKPDVTSDDGLLEALAAIAAGEMIDVIVLAHAALKGLVSGGKRKPKLSKRGVRKLATLRETKAERDALASLPDTFEALAAEYQATLARRHAAALAGDEEETERQSDRIDLLARKVRDQRDGGHFDGNGIEEICVPAAAPVGEVPMWGQRGLFRLDIDGVSYIVAHDDWMDFGAYAEDRGKPFVSATGFVSLGNYDGITFGQTVAAQAEAYIREEIARGLAGQDRKGGRKAAGKGKKGALPFPDRCYRLPASWQELYEHDAFAGVSAIEVVGEAADEVAGGEEPYVLAARPDAEKNALIDAALAAGHTITMTSRIDEAGTPVSVASCQCGLFRDEAPRGDHTALDAAIEEHWVAVLSPGGGAKRRGKSARAGAAAPPVGAAL